MVRYPLAKERHRLRKHGLCLGRNTATGGKVYLLPKYLRTHLHLLGPTGCGKSRLLLWLFQLLCARRRPVVLIDPKGGLYRMARDWALRHGLGGRLVLFDLAADIVPGYNPLRANGLSVSRQTKWVREGIRSAWGQADFDQTPQLARFLYLSLYVARACDMPLTSAIDVLRPKSATRAQVLPKISDAFVYSALLAYHRLPDRRKEELTASTVARLESFVADVFLRQVIESHQSIDIADILTQNKILLVNLAKYQPILPDDVRLLGRLLVNDLLSHVYTDDRFDEDHPCYFLCDEVHNLATRQLCDALDEGRGIGFHAVLAHQHLAQLEDEDKSGYLLRSVMTDARTKVIFGGLDYADLEPLAKNVMLGQIDPMRVKDEIWTPQFVPVETTRVVPSYSRSRSRGRSVSVAASATDGETHGTSFGQTTTVGTSRHRMHSRSVTASRQRTVGQSVTDGEAATVARGHAHSRGRGTASGQSYAMSSLAGAGTSTGQVMRPADETLGGGDVIIETSGESNHAAMAQVFGESSVQSSMSVDSESEMQARTRSHAVSRHTMMGEGMAVQRGTSEGTSESIAHGTSTEESHSTSHAVTHGTTQGVSEEEGTSEGETITPWHEMHERPILSSRTYFSVEEQWLLAIQQLSDPDTGLFHLKTPGTPACLIEAPFVADPWLGARKLEAKLARVYREPYYIEAQADAESPDEVPLSLPPGQVVTEPSEPAEDEPDLVFRYRRS